MRGDEEPPVSKSANGNCESGSEMRGKRPDGRARARLARAVALFAIRQLPFAFCASYLRRFSMVRRSSIGRDQAGGVSAIDAGLVPEGHAPLSTLASAIGICTVRLRDPPAVGLQGGVFCPEVIGSLAGNAEAAARRKPVCWPAARERASVVYGAAPRTRKHPTSRRRDDRRNSSQNNFAMINVRVGVVVNGAGGRAVLGGGRQ